MSALDRVTADIRHLRDTIRPGFGRYFSARLAYRVTKQEYDALIAELDTMQRTPGRGDPGGERKVHILGMKIEPTYEGVSDSESYYVDCDLRGYLGRDRRRLAGVDTGEQAAGPEADGGGPA